MLSQYLQDNSEITQAEKEAAVKQAIANQQNFQPWTQDPITQQKLTGLQVLTNKLSTAIINCAGSKEGKDDAFLMARDLRMVSIIGSFLTQPGGGELFVKPEASAEGDDSKN